MNPDEIDIRYPSATLISVFPAPIREKKIGLMPAEYFLPKPALGEVTFLVIQKCTAADYIDMYRGTRTIVLQAHDVAKSIVEDFCNSMILVGPDAKPGLIYIDGIYTSQKQIKEELADEIKQAREYQTNWFKRLVEDGERNFRSAGGNPRSINDLHRIAARSLGTNVTWMNIEQADSVKPCIGCRTPVSSLAVICPVCRTIQDPARASELGLIQLAVEPVSAKKEKVA